MILMLGLGISVRVLHLVFHMPTLYIFPCGYGLSKPTPVPQVQLSFEAN